MLLHFQKARRRVLITLAAMLACAAACTAQQAPPNLRQADTDFRAGVAAISHNDLNAARADFENVVRLAPDAEQGHSALGAVLVRMGKTAAAIPELQKALSLQPGDASAQQNLALAYEQVGQPAKALPWFAKLYAGARVENRSLPGEVLAAWARALDATGQFGPAAAKMKDAVAEAPQSAELRDELGSIYAQRKDWPEAQQAFSAALAMNPQLAAAHLHLGMTLEAEHQAGAAAELRKAYELAPDNGEIQLEYARMVAAQGDDREAIPLLRRAVERNPGATAAAYELGLALQRANQVNEAIPLLQKAAAAESRNADVLANLGMALCQAQRAKDAVPILQRAVSLAPANPTARENLAAAYIQLSQFDDAVRQLQTALKLSPDSPQLHYNLGLALKMQDDGADAIPQFEAAEKLNASAPEPPYALGLLYLQAGRYSDAARELNVSLELQPANGDGWATLGSVYNHLDQLPQASSALQEAIRQRPDQPDAYLTLATVLVKENQPQQAREERAKAADLMRANMNRQRAEVASNSGNDLLKSGKVSDAIVEFRNAVSFDPGYADAHLGLANALQRQGNLAEAAAERQRAAVLAKQSGH